MSPSTACSGENGYIFTDTDSILLAPQPRGKMAESPTVLNKSKSKRRALVGLTRVTCQPCTDWAIQGNGMLWLARSQSHVQIVWLWKKRGELKILGWAIWNRQFCTLEMAEYWQFHQLKRNSHQKSRMVKLVGYIYKSKRNPRVPLRRIFGGGSDITET